MTLDWNAFTPWTALAGGALIGLATLLFVLLNGRIAGISGILGGLLVRARGDVAWRLAFVLGLLAAPWLWWHIAAWPSTVIDADAVTVVVAGLLVGFGTRLGSGCTSGHGVCGISRLSPRSLLATCTFVAAGFATVWVIRHVLGT